MALCCDYGTAAMSCLRDGAAHGSPDGIIMALSCDKTVKPCEECRLCRRCRLRGEALQFLSECGRQSVRCAEVARGLLQGESRQHGGLVIGGHAVGMLDVGRNRRRQCLGQPEGAM